MDMDRDLRSIQEVRNMVRLGQIATEQIATYSQEQIDRINALARKSKTPEGLTEVEKIEQQKLRRLYIDSFKESLVGQLENTYIVDEKGNKKKVERKGKK